MPWKESSVTYVSGRTLSLVEKNEGQASLDYAVLVGGIAALPTQALVPEEQIRLLRNAIAMPRARGVRSKIGYRPRLPGSDPKESEALPGRRVSLIGGAGRSFKPESTKSSLNGHILE